MRTKFGEITIGKIIIALFIIFLATGIFLSTAESPAEILNLPAKDYFLSFFIYIISFITGLLVNLWDYLKKLFL